jgi:hypothetical protein
MLSDGTTAASVLAVVEVAAAVPHQQQQHLLPGLVATGASLPLAVLPQHFGRTPLRTAAAAASHMLPGLVQHSIR